MKQFKANLTSHIKSKYSKEVLGERVKVHYTEHKRGNVDVDALFESEELIGYTTFSNDIY